MGNSAAEEKRYGRGCKPRPASIKLSLGVQTFRFGTFRFGRVTAALPQRFGVQTFRFGRVTGALP